MKLRVMAAAALALTTWTSASNASLITQQVDFYFANGPVSGSSFAPLPITDGDDFTASVSPFDSSLGTLNLFIIDWLVNVSVSGTVGDNGGGGGDLNGGGPYSASGSSYNGDGCSVGGPAAPIDQPPEFISCTVADRTTFSVADAGFTYDPAILTAVLGGTDFDLLWGAALSVTYTEVNNLFAEASGRVILSYDYTPSESVPAPATLALVGLGLAGLGWKRRKNA